MGGAAEGRGGGRYGADIALTASHFLLSPFGHIIRYAHSFGAVGKANVQNALRFVPSKQEKAR